MATTTISDEFKKYFVNLTATSQIVSSFGTTFVLGSNLYISEESEKHVDMLTIYPTPGAPPNKDRQRMESSVQIRLKVASNAKGLRTMQDIIQTLHENESICASAPGKVYASHSAPLVLGKIEGGKFSIFTANFNIKHIKL